MRVLQDEVRSNIVKSYFVMFFFIIVIGILGAIVGFFFGNLIYGIVLAFVGGLLYTLIAYNSGESMVLKMTNAKPATKLEYPHLFHSVEALSIAAGIKKPKPYVIESEALNAFATGKNPENSYVAVTTGLIKKLNRQELEGVLAHEISHIKNYDIRVMMVSVILSGVIIFMSQIIFRMFLFGGGRNGGGGNNDNSAMKIIGLVVGLIFLILSPIFAQLIKLAVSRKREYLADASAGVLTRYPPGLASALEKIKNSTQELKTTSATSHLFISEPKKKKVSSLFSTHPPIDERIKRLKEM